MANEKSQKLLNSPYWVRKLRTRHSLMDLNKDGTVAKEDFDIFADNLIRNGKLSETLGQSVRERVMRIWLAFGVPDDAKVTADEWVTHAANISEETYTALYNSYFDAIDLDQDGEISYRELEIFFMSIGSDPADAQECFNLFDTDKDGTLSRSEYVAVGLKFVGSTDDSFPSQKLYGMRF